MQITLQGHGAADGAPMQVPVRVGDTIRDSLLRAGAPFPFSCQAGNCGTCKCVLVSGEVRELEHSDRALDPAERARGIILACRTRVRGDTVVRRID
jgi:ferredoxin